MRKSLFLVILLFLLVCMPSIHALTGEILGDTIVITVAIDQGKSPELVKTISVKNTNDVPVDVFLMALGGISKEIALPEESVTVQPGETKEIPFTVKSIFAGMYSGKVSALFYAQNQTSFKVLSPSIILNIGYKNDTEWLKKSKLSDVSKVVASAASTAKKDTTTTKTTDTKKTTTTTVQNKDTAKDASSDPPLDDTSDESSNTDPASSDDAKKPNPVIGGFIFLGIVIIGALFLTTIYVLMNSSQAQRKNVRYVAVKKKKRR